MIYDGHRGDFVKKKNLTFNQDNFMKLFYDPDAHAFKRIWKLLSTWW